jgi:cytochrome c oxidase subunit 2
MNKKAKGKRQKEKGKTESESSVFTFAFYLLPFVFLQQSALDPAGPHAARIGRLWWLMFYVELGVFLLVGAAVLVAAFRKRKERKKASDEPDTSPEPKREQRMTRVVTGGIIATALILFVFLVGSFYTGRALYSPADDRALSIKVTGHQWWWDVEYDAVPASDTVHTANEIHIPVGQLVKLRLTSSDVIHSLWVPNLNGKKDLIPGHEIVLTFQADREGEFRGQCAEYCGYQHAHMAFKVIAEAPEKFYEWMNRQRAPAAEPANEAEARGREVFLKGPCVMCHSIRGTDAGGRVGPELTHLKSRTTIAAATLPNTRGHLAGWVTNSQEIKPGNQMPPVPLEPEELQALLAYLESLK